MSNWSRGRYFGDSTFQEIGAIFECENYHHEDDLIYKVSNEKFGFKETLPGERKPNLQSSAQLVDYYIKSAHNWLDKNDMEHLKQYSGCRVEGQFLVLYKEEIK